LVNSPDSGTIRKNIVIYKYMKEGKTKPKNNSNEAEKVEVEDISEKHESMSDPKHVIIDACNQFVSLTYLNKYTPFDLIKNETIPMLTTLERFINEAPTYNGKHLEIIEKVKQYDSGIFYEYNKFINLLKNKKLTHEEFLEILDKSKAIYKDL